MRVCDPLLCRGDKVPERHSLSRGKIKFGSQFWRCHSWEGMDHLWQQERESGALHTMANP